MSSDQHVCIGGEAMLYPLRTGLCTRLLHRALQVAWHAKQHKEERFVLLCHTDRLPSQGSAAQPGLGITCIYRLLRASPLYTSVKSSLAKMANITNLKYHKTLYSKVLDCDFEVW